MRTEQEIRQTIENLADSENQFQQKIEEAITELSEYLRKNAKSDDYCKIYKKTLYKLEKYRYWVELLLRAGSEKDTLLYVLGETD